MNGSGNSSIFGANKGRFNGTISMNTHTISSKSSSVEKTITNIDTYIKQLENAINELDSMWKGPKHDYFIKNVKPFISRLKEHSDSIKECNNYATNFIKELNNVNINYISENVNLE